MAQGPLVPSNGLNMFEVSISAVRPATRTILSSMLNGRKVISTEEGLPRDFRGLLQLTGIKVSLANNIQDPTAFVLNSWEKHKWADDDIKPSIGALQSYLKQLDRWDVFDDTAEMLERDALEYTSKSTAVCNADYESQILTIDDSSRLERGLPVQTYDAFLLYAQEDESFAFQMIDKLENNFGLKLCVKERDLIGGGFEHAAIMKLIAERCNRVILIVSPNFLRSEANKFFLSFAQALGIESRRRKIIPCLYQRCQQLPPELSYYFQLDYNRSSRLWNFWEKLRDSIKAPVATSLSHTNPGLNLQINSAVNNRCTIQEITSSEENVHMKNCVKEKRSEEVSESRVDVTKTTLINMSDPTTHYQSCKFTTDIKTQDWEPSKPSQSQSLPITSQTKSIKSALLGNFFTRSLSDKDSSSSSRLESGKSKKKKWFMKNNSKKKEIAVVTS